MCLASSSAAFLAFRVVAFRFHAPDLAFDLFDTVNFRVSGSPLAEVKVAIS
jgi:hypothetical protein